MRHRQHSLTYLLALHLFNHRYLLMVEWQPGRNGNQNAHTVPLLITLIMRVDVSESPPR